MWLAVPPEGIKQEVPGAEHVRDARMTDVPAIAALELEISGVSREQEYRFCTENASEFWHTYDDENAHSGIDGFLPASLHPALHMLGQGVCQTDDEPIALIKRELEVNRGRSPLVLEPVEREKIVRQLYEWGSR